MSTWLAASAWGSVASIVHRVTSTPQLHPLIGPQARACLIGQVVSFGASSVGRRGRRSDRAARGGGIDRS